jgi:hypothetical protein
MADPSLRTREENLDPDITSDQTAAESGSAPVLSSIGPRYRLLEEISRGGMGTVINEDMRQALTAHRQALALRRELAPHAG